MENKFKLKLAVFDFDATIIKDNSDTYINELLIQKYNAHKLHLDENNDQSNLSEIDLRRFIFPDTVEQLYSKFNWPTRMNAAFEYIHSRFACSTQEMLDKLREIKIDESMKRLFKILWQNNYEIFILSDANNLFIETILKENNLLDKFRGKIITNETFIDERGVIKIKPYYLENKEDKMPYNCAYCVIDCAEPSICKRELLKDLIERKKSQMECLDNEIHVVYGGDGKNDFCPGLILGMEDFYFPRKGYNLAKLLENSEYLEKLKLK